MYLYPIKTETDYEKTLIEIEELFSAQPDTPEGDRLDVLTTLVEAYERNRHPILPPHPIDALRYYIESRGLTRRDLEPYIGSRARVAEVLNKRRALTMGMIRRLNQGLGIPAETLIQAYPLSRPETSRSVSLNTSSAIHANAVHEQKVGFE